MIVTVSNLITSPLSNRTRAMLDTFCLVFLMVLTAGLGVYVIHTFDATAILNVIMIGVFAFIVYTLYSMRLAELEYKETLNKMVDQ
jgi:hypothetical protein